MRTRNKISKTNVFASIHNSVYPSIFPPFDTTYPAMSCHVTSFSSFFSRLITSYKIIWNATCDKWLAFPRSRFKLNTRKREKKREKESRSLYGNQTSWYPQYIIDNVQTIVHAIIYFHDRSLIITTITIVGSTKDSHNILVLTPIISL